MKSEFIIGFFACFLADIKRLFSRAVGTSFLRHAREKNNKE